MDQFIQENNLFSVYVAEPQPEERNVLSLYSFILRPQNNRRIARSVRRIVSDISFRGASKPPLVLHGRSVGCLHHKLHYAAWSNPTKLSANLRGPEGF